jgi:hypothetical protein
MATTELQTTVFLGEYEEAKRIFKGEIGKGLTEEQEYVLRRYLDIEIPERFQNYSRFMDDGVYLRVLSTVLDRLPAEAKSQI